MMLSRSSRVRRHCSTCDWTARAAPWHDCMRRMISRARSRENSARCARRACAHASGGRSEEHTSELQSRQYLVCRLLLEKKNIVYYIILSYLYYGDKNSYRINIAFSMIVIEFEMPTNQLHTKNTQKQQ